MNERDMDRSQSDTTQMAAAGAAVCLHNTAGEAKNGVAPTVRASPHADAPMWRVVTHVRQERRAGGPLPEDNATVRELTPTRSATDPDEINEARERSRRLQGTTTVHTTLYTTQRVTVHVLQAEALIQGTSGMQVYGR